ncbi:hypothetical protein HG530_012929 [Fusarium avenaceum]|nr:hypothetical protein HG530_012929 [Fusarium avenaceum]
MKDPFPFPPSVWLSEKTQPWADYFDLPTLPMHIHEVFAAALLYSVVFWPISPLISNFFAPEHYSKLSRKRRLNWDAHVVSMVQSCLINGLAIWVMFVDTELSNMQWEERIWGYTGGAGFIQALAAGYFLWDLVVTSLNFDVFGIGTLAHAVAALLVYSLGFLYNGLALLFTFFSCRLVYGTYSSFRVYRDVWSAINVTPDMKALMMPTMTFAHPDSTVPMWIGVAYLASNITLNSLNFYWFFMMIRAVRKRFEPSSSSQEKTEKSRVTETEIDLSSVATGSSKAGAGRRRKA